jgi:outer membrane protein TolC
MDRAVFDGTGTWVLFHPAQAPCTWLGKFLLLLTVSVVAGCVPFQPRLLEPAATLADYEGRSLHDAGLSAFIAQHRSKMQVQGNGWGLGKLTLAALYYHPSLQVSRSQEAMAEAAGITAGERPNPTVSWSPAYNTSSSGISPWILGFGLDVPIETAGKRGLRREEAARKLESARMKVAAQAWTVRSQLRKALVSLHAAQREETLLKAQETLQTETSHLLEEQRKAGQSPPFLATQARIALSQTQLSLHDAQRKVAGAKVQLAAALGVPTKALQGVALDFAELDRVPSNVSTRTARRLALVNRSDILGVLSEYAAAEATLHLEIARQYPDLHLSPGYERDQGENKWSVGLSLDLPLNRNRGKIAEAEAARESAAATFRQVQSEALSEIELAVVNHRGANEKVTAARGLLEDLKKQEKVTQGMLKAGEIGKFELTERQLEVNTAALAVLDAELGAQEALGALEDALQAPATLPESVWSASLR